MNKSARSSLMTTTIIVGTLCAETWRACADTFVQSDLVSDIAGEAAITDQSLVNPWGISNTATSPFWVSDQGTNTATLYAVTGNLDVSKVTAVNPPTGNISIPTTASGPQGPTGQVANTGTSFVVNGAAAHFIFANLNGTISAWNGTGTAAVVQSTATSPGNVPYTGLAINQSAPGGPLLYAASAAGINVFNGSFQPATNLPAGAFATPSAIAQEGLVPFNVQNNNGNVYVTYAPAGRPAQQNATAGMGAVAIFDATGALQKTILGNNTPLAAPWGIALAPSNFGSFANDLLIGNFSYKVSEINAFDPTTGAFLGTIPIDPGTGQSPGGLWALEFGTGGSNGNPDTLFFTDGIDGETHGLFGAISDVTPLPDALPLFAAGLGVLGLLGWVRRKHAQAAVT